MTGPFKAEWTTEQFVTYIEEGKLSFANSKQRGLVWSKKQKIYLINSVFNGYPIPPIYAIEKENGDFDVLDGQQRLTTIKEFRLDGLQLDDSISKNMDGKLFSQLSQKQQNQFNTVMLTMEYYKDATEIEEREIFKRLNNGKVLSSIEKIRAESAHYGQIRGLADHKLFSVIASKNQLNRFMDEDIVIKSYIILCRGEYDLQTVKVRDIIRNAKFTKDDSTKIKNAFDVLYEALNELDQLPAPKGDDVLINPKTNKPVKVYKATFTKAKSKTNIISLVQLADALLQDNSKAEAGKKMRGFIINFFSPAIEETSVNEEYNALIQTGSSKPENVKERLAIIESSYKELV